MKMMRDICRQKAKVIHPMLHIIFFVTGRIGTNNSLFFIGRKIIMVSTSGVRGFLIYLFFLLITDFYSTVRRSSRMLWLQN